MTPSLHTTTRTLARCLLGTLFSVGGWGCGNADRGAPVGGSAGGANSTGTSGGTTALGTASSSNPRGGTRASWSDVGTSGPGTSGSSTSGSSTGSSNGGNGTGTTDAGGSSTKIATSAVGGRSDPGAFGGSSAFGGMGVGGRTSTEPSSLGGLGAVGSHAGGTVSTTGGTKTSAVLVGGGANTAGARSTLGGATATTGSPTAGGKTATGGATSGTLPAVTIYIAGDSTVSTYTDTAANNDQAGWGQLLHEIFNGKVTVVNRAAGGRTAYWFYLEGAVTKILDSIKPGDYFFIQFGTNDQNTSATFTVDGVTYPRYAEASTDFKTQLKQYYLGPTKAKGAVPVLVTPPPRNSAYCNGGNGLSAYATAMVELGAAENVAVLDNNAKTFNYLKAICPKPTDAASEAFFKNNDGSIDGTHFQENGARKMAGFIGEEIQRVDLGLAAYLL